MKVAAVKGNCKKLQLYVRARNRLGKWCMDNGLNRNASISV